MESDIPPKGEFPDYEPRVYFGESSPEYSIVGAPEGATPRELDYPSDEEADRARSTTPSRAAADRRWAICSTVWRMR